MITPLFIYLLTLLNVSNPISTLPHGSLVLSVNNIRPTKGQILVSVYNQAKGFPSDRQHAFMTKAVPFNGTSMQITLDNLPYGKYAIALLHDENNNYQMDFNWLGMPKEGYAASNNATRTLGTPRFEEALIILESPQKKLPVSMYYF